MSETLERRRFLIGAAASLTGALVPGARAFANGIVNLDDFGDTPVDEADVAPAPVLYLSHGGPNLAVSEIRGRELRAWGSGLTKPAGILSVTPHYRARGLELGAVGPGRGAHSFPARFARGIGDLDYRTPDNSALADRVTALLESRGEVRRSTREANDHTTWMPLLHLFPDADVPVLELALPFAPDLQIFELGRALAALRTEGVVIHCSGQMTHNLASLGRRGPPIPWALAFDEWVQERVEGRDYDALVDWRQAAPDPYLAHPDDGGHFDVLLVGLGAVEATRLTTVSFPVSGFELGALSKRCIELR